jgi:hypothetical protein
LKGVRRWRGGRAAARTIRGPNRRVRMARSTSDHSTSRKRALQGKGREQRKGLPSDRTAKTSRRPRRRPGALQPPHTPAHARPDPKAPRMWRSRSLRKGAASPPGHVAEERYLACRPGTLWAPETTSSRAMGRLSHGRLAKSSPCRSRDKTCSKLVQRNAKPCRAPGSRPAEVPPERLGRQIVLCDVAVRADAKLAHPSHPILDDELREPSTPILGLCKEGAD